MTPSDERGTSLLYALFIISTTTIITNTFITIPQQISALHVHRGIEGKHVLLMGGKTMWLMKMMSKVGGEYRTPRGI